MNRQFDNLTSGFSASAIFVQKSMHVLQAQKALGIRRFGHVNPGSSETPEPRVHSSVEPGFTANAPPLNPGSNCHFVVALAIFFYAFERFLPLKTECK